MDWYITFGISTGVGIIAYFLKRTMSRVDKTESDLNKVKEEYVPSKANEKVIDECKRDIRQIRESYTPKQEHVKDIDELRKDVKVMKDKFLTKEDFFREQAKTEKKLDRIMDILMEMKEGK